MADAEGVLALVACVDGNLNELAVFVTSLAEVALMRGLSAPVEFFLDVSTLLALYLSYELDHDMRHHAIFQVGLYFHMI